MKKQLLLALLVVLVAPFTLAAQSTYTCGQPFYDSGGSTNDYSSNENTISYIFPTTNGLQALLFLSSVSIADGDTLTIYDGPSVNSPVISVITNVTNQQYSFIASNFSGQLCVAFQSNSDTVASGWEGMVECLQTSCDPPTQINVTALSASQVSMSWAPTSTIPVQWEVLILPAGTPPSPTSQGVFVTSPAYATSLNPGVYTVYIRTLCNGSISSWSTPTTFTLGATQTCELPTNFSVSSITATGAAFAWTAQGAALQWEIVVLPQAAGLPTSTTTGTVITQGPFLASGLTPNTQYNFFIRSLCSASTSDWSAGTYFQTSQSPVIAPNCGEVFLDNGGANANYANNSNNTYVICPNASGQVVTVTFSSFDVEALWDGLYVYNGNSASAPQISSGNNGTNIPGGLPGAFWGTTIPGPFTSTSTDGCLTFRFVSDNVVQNAGWVGNVTCANAPTCAAPTNSNATNITSTGAVISWVSNSPSAAQWELVVTSCTVTAPTPNFPTILVTSNPYTLTGLSAATCYNVFIRSLCGTNGTSAWTLYSFTTLTAAPTCGGIFTDPAGPNANYANSTDSTTTICPTNSGEVVTVTFTTFATEANWDGLYVFNGNSINAPMIPSTNGASNVPGGIAGSWWGTLTGSALPSFTSTAPDGCLTFRFRSDGSVNAAGWVATITCAPPPTCFKPTALVASSIGQTSMTVSWTPALTTDNQWEVVALPCGTAAPSTTFTGGILTTTPTVNLTGLNSSTCYTVYVRTLCSATDLSSFALLSNLTTLVVPPVCGGTFVDAGGVNGNYPNNSNVTYTICPNTVGEIVTVTFTSFNTEANWDPLYVYNGNSTSAPMIASANGAGNTAGAVAGGYWGTAIPGPFTSSSPDGCLTFKFLSDASISQAGWTANVTCAPDLPKILVIAFVDLNNNGLQDAGEPNFPNGNFVVQQNNSGTNTMVYAPMGAYTIYDNNPINTYDISYEILPEAQPYFSGTGFTVNDANIPANGGTQVYYFPISNIQAYSDVEVSLSPYGAPPRPGLNYMQRLSIKNNGIAAASGTVTYTKPTPVTIATISQNGTVANANGFTYAFTNLAPNQTLVIYVTLTVPAAPTVNLNNVLTATASVTSGNDINAQNNNASLSQIVVNSWDPNDKMEAHGDKIPFSAFAQDDYLFYTIRFQNMGTANAIDVRIEDDLSPLIDEESIRMVSSSHNYVMTREGNHVEWNFSNIQLVPEIVSPQASQGFVTFRVQLNPGFQVGTIVPNTASIYFDSNPAIVTNTWTTKFTAPLGIGNQEYVAFVMYPNPAHNEITLTGNTNGELIQDVIIYDVLGKTVKTVRQLNASTATLSIAELAQGVYTVAIQSNNGLQLTQKLVVR